MAGTYANIFIFIKKDNGKNAVKQTLAYDATKQNELTSKNWWKQSCRASENKTNITYKTNNAYACH